MAGCHGEKHNLKDFPLPMVLDKGLYCLQSSGVFIVTVSSKLRQFGVRAHVGGRVMGVHATQMM